MLNLCLLLFVQGFIKIVVQVRYKEYKYLKKKPKLNRLWKEIISSKVFNQADVLHQFTQDEHLYTLIKRIHSGDKGNIEAVASAYYFRHLFDRSFSRKIGIDTRNIALNYGYSIIRSSIIRHIIGYGLNPSFGIWHSSELNAFNLADDLLEPFRPIVDRYVKENIQKDTFFSQEIKYALMALLYSNLTSTDGKNIIVKEAIKSIVASYQSFCLGKREDIAFFFLPKA
jgi:CRISPR-associated protein Cas1